VDSENGHKQVNPVQYRIGRYIASDHRNAVPPLVALGASASEMVRRLIQPRERVTEVAAF